LVFTGILDIAATGLGESHENQIDRDRFDDVFFRHCFRHGPSPHLYAWYRCAIFGPSKSSEHFGNFDRAVRQFSPGKLGADNVTVSYELVGGSTFTTLLDGSTIVDQGLTGGGTGVWEDVNYSNGGTALISGVEAIQFTFGAQQNGYVGYRELDIQGTATAVPEPSTNVLVLAGFLGLIFALRRKICV
jgi:hypothetical protein